MAICNSADGKQNYQCKDCKRQFIGDHALSYLGCNSGITRKILQLMVRGSGIRDIAEVERISIGKVLRTLTESAYQIQPKQSHYESLEVDEFWTFVGNKIINNGLFTPTIEKQVRLLLMFGVREI
ncbi:putative transposase [Acinetobacter sp. 479375]|nr:putative transposase [Acinetobacter sp. 479375]